MMIAYSKDGGHTWSNWKYRDVGEVGQFIKKVRAGPFGAKSQFTFKFRVTDPVDVVIFAAGATVETRE